MHNRVPRGFSMLVGEVHISHLFLQRVLKPLYSKLVWGLTMEPVAMGECNSAEDVPMKPSNYLTA